MENHTTDPPDEQPPDEKLGAKLDPSRLTILIDQQEKCPLSVLPFQSELCHLTVGDYWLKGLGAQAVAEWKSEPDLIYSIGTDRDRFDRQVLRLMGCKHKVLLVGSTWERLNRGGWRSQISPQSVIGSLTGLMAAGLPVALVGDREEAGKFLAKWFFIIANRRLQESRELLGEIRHRRKEAPR